MLSILPEIEVYPVHHLPIIKAYADQLGLVSLINHESMEMLGAMPPQASPPPQGPCPDTSA
jgi:hypothetical protein